MREIRVIGAGFTGTLAAYLLARRGERVTIVDSGDVPGGMIRTLQQPAGDVETAANGFLCSRLIEQVADDIGVTLVPASRVARRRRFLWTANSRGPTRWPLSVLQTAATAVRLLVGRITGRLRPRPGETVEQWGLRNLGRAATDRLLSTALLGIYAAPASELSATLVLGRLFDPRPKGPRSRLTGTVAPRGGMGEWFSAMRRWLEARGVTFVNDVASPLQPGDSPTVICTGAPAAAVLLESVAPDLAQSIATIEMVPVTSVSVFAQSSPVDRHGFGCLFHPGAGFFSLGVLFSSDIFPHRFAEETRAEAWIIGGRVLPEVVSLDDDAVLRHVLSDRERLGLTGPVTSTVVTRWPAAFPLYGIALEQSLSRLPSPPPGVMLAGNYLGSLGLTRIAERLQHDLDRFRP